MDVKDFKDYLKVDEGVDDNLIKTFINVAQDTLQKALNPNCSYNEILQRNPQIDYLLLPLIADLYQNREYVTSTTNLIENKLWRNIFEAIKYREALYQKQQGDHHADN